MKIKKIVLCVVFLFSISGITGNCFTNNFDKGLQKLFHQCCIMGVETTTHMGMHTIKTCEFFDNIRLHGVIAGIKKVFGNSNSETLRIQVINSNKTVSNNPKLNPILGKMGFIRCDGQLFLAHYIDTGMKRTWFIFDNNNKRLEIAKCNIE